MRERFVVRAFLELDFGDSASGVFEHIVDVATNALQLLLKQQLGFELVSVQREDDLGLRSIDIVQQVAGPSEALFSILFRQQSVPYSQQFQLMRLCICLQGLVGFCKQLIELC